MRDKSVNIMCHGQGVKLGLPTHECQRLASHIEQSSHDNKDNIRLEGQSRASINIGKHFSREVQLVPICSLYITAFIGIHSFRAKDDCKHHSRMKVKSKGLSKECFG